MTLNIWNYTRPWKARLQRIAEEIRFYNPDVVALQETRHDFRYARGKGQGEQIAELTGYISSSAVAQVYVPLFHVDEGLTTLTRVPPLSVDVHSLSQLPHERADENRRICLGVRLEIGDRQVTVFNTHFSLSVAARMSNARECLSIMQRTTGPTVLMGDLNAEPGSPEIRFLVSAEGEGNVLDCWVAVHRDEPGFTYAPFSPVRRIDYILARGIKRAERMDIAGCAAIDGVYPSDHMALVADIEL